VAQHLALALSLGGYLGGLLVLTGYALTTTGRLSATSPAAQAVNTAGALLLVANGVVLAAWPSVGVNLAWIAIGLAAAWRARADRGPEASGAGGAGATTVPAQRSGDLEALEVWPGDWDAAAEQLAASSEPARTTACPPTAPLPVLGDDRP